MIGENMSLQSAMAVVAAVLRGALAVYPFVTREGWDGRQKKVSRIGEGLDDSCRRLVTSRWDHVGTSTIAVDHRGQPIKSPFRRRTLAEHAPSRVIISISNCGPARAHLLCLRQQRRTTTMI